jgi:hypothetical protein
MTSGLSAGRVRKIYRFVKESSSEYSVETVCRLLEVSRSGYYAWLAKPMSDRAREDARLLRLIRASFKASHGIYGAPKPGASVGGIWQLSDGVEMELWDAVDGRVVAGPALAPDGRIAFTVQRERMTSLYVMDADGGVPRAVSAELDVRGTPAWSPDGEWIAIGVIRDSEPRLLRLSPIVVKSRCSSAITTPSIRPGHRAAGSSCTRASTSAPTCERRFGSAWR